MIAPARSHRALTCALLFLVLAGCNSKPSAAPGPAATTGTSAEQRDSGAMADLAASDKWKAPRCRWLKTGAWVLAYPQETALYRAARELGYIEMDEVGQDNRIGTPEPAWRIALTEAGRAEAAACPPSSKSDVWGVPVSRRRLISGAYVSEAQGYGRRTTFEVVYEWLPTAVGERVKHDLTGNMAVEEGVYRTKVYLKTGPDFIGAGPNGWYVDAIDDLGAQRVR